MVLEGFIVIVFTMYRAQPFPQEEIFSREFEYLVPASLRHLLELPQELLHKPCIAAIAGGHFGALVPHNRAIVLLLKMLHSLCSEGRFLSHGK